MRKQAQTFTVPPNWQPKRRVQGGIRQIRRDGNRQLTFNGQDADEVVERVVRQHPIFLIRPALPAIGMLIGIALALILFFRLPTFNTLWGLLSLTLLIGFLVATGYFIWKNLLIWWVNIDIITNKRIINCRGLIQPTRQIFSLDKITQVSVTRDSPWSGVFAFGNVHIYVAGKEHVLRHVYNPNRVRDSIHNIHQNIKATVKPPQKAPQLNDPEMNELIARLGKKENMPSLPNADERYEHLRKGSEIRRPLRRFGGPLRIPAEVTYGADEHTVMYIQRSKWILAGRLFVPALGALTALGLTIAFPQIIFLTGAAILALLVMMGLITMNYVDDIFILTNKRIIDIERKFIFFFEERIEAEYKSVRETKIKITNIVQNFLDVGNVYIETQGNSPNINMTLVDHPYFIADKVNEIKGFKDKFDSTKAKNDRQDELSKWFTSVVSVLEKKMASQGVPDLKGKDIWSASSIAESMGMRVIPVGEDDSYPDIEAGKIVKQHPMPGTLMEHKAPGQLEIHVTLSKRG